MDRRPLRVLHLSTNDFTGGAARAAYRLHHGLLSRGLDSQMLVQNKERDEPQIHRAIQFAPRKWVELLDRAPMSLYPRRKRGVFTTGWVSSSSLQRAVKKINPDLIHTHWITGGFLRPESFRGLKIPMVWSLHDMWPLTGGCHYDGGLRRF